jgi:hypothetical protein
MFTLDEMRMKTAFTPFTLDESSAMHIQSVKCKFALMDEPADPVGLAQELPLCRVDVAPHRGGRRNIPTTTGN